MQFHVGDVVVHPAHGLGHIVRLAEKHLAGAARLYYEVATQNSTVWVPVEPHEAIAMRLLTAKSDLARYRHLLKSRPAALAEDHRQRQTEVAQHLRQGSFPVLCEVVRDLTARGWRKPLRDADTAALRRAREFLCQEWAASEGVSVEEATQEINALLEKARQTYA